MFTSLKKNKNFDAIRIKTRISASFLVKMLQMKFPAFIIREKCGGHSIYSYFRITSIKHALSKKLYHTLRRTNKIACISNASVPDMPIIIE